MKGTFRERETMNAEQRLRFEMNYCRQCDACRTLLDYSCLVFPELFRLVDQWEKTKEEPTTDELRHLVNLCNFCALCPCLELRSALIQAKTEFMERYGIPFKIKALENMEMIGKVGGAVPQLSNLLLRNGLTRGVIEKTVGIHEDRRFPRFPQESFSKWIKRRKKYLHPNHDKKKKVAYFAGCTARYLFPEVAKSAVEVLERNGIEVYYPEQQCCGMPSLLEGDRELTQEFARFNVPRLLEAVKAGYDIVCSCPTCGYLIKHVLREGAYYSAEYLDSDTSEDGRLYIEVPKLGARTCKGEGAFYHLPKIFREALRDEGYFSSFKPAERIMIAESTYDMGEYLRQLDEEGQLDTGFGPVRLRAAYYPPCHLREQKIGKPYLELLEMIPELLVEPVEGLYCCGNAGIMGFKEEFHNRSIRIGSSLVGQLRGLDPEAIATDCLSCRIQFNQMTGYKILHPVEIMRLSYEGFPAKDKREAA
jgi:glycerol-3-phosphate dehydrogenase subunit C